MKTLDILNVLAWECKDGDINLRALREFLKNCKGESIEEIVEEINKTKFIHKEFISPNLLK